MSACCCSPQSDGVILGFISVTCDVDLKRLRDFDLSEFEGLYRQIKNDEAAAQSDPRGEEKGTIQSSHPQQVTHNTSGLTRHSFSSQVNKLSLLSQQEEKQPSGVEESDAFCVQFFVMDKNHEMQ